MSVSHQQKLKIMRFSIVTLPLNLNLQVRNYKMKYFWFYGKYFQRTLWSNNCGIPILSSAGWLHGNTRHILERWQLRLREKGEHSAVNRKNFSFCFIKYFSLWPESQVPAPCPACSEYWTPSVCNGGNNGEVGRNIQDDIVEKSCVNLKAAIILESNRIIPTK